VRRAHLVALAAISLLSTGAVLAPAGGAGRRGASVRAALARAIVVRAALPSAAPAAPVPAPVAADPAPTTSVPRPVAAASRPAAAAPAPAPAPRAPAKAAPARSRLGHLFVVALTGTSEEEVFGPGSPAPYLASELRPRGTLLSGFRPLDGADLPNYVAALGGQPPNAATRAECATFSEFPTSVVVSKTGVVGGDGCVYPNSVITLADQLTSSRRSWAAYVEDLGNGPDGAKTCRHPASDGPDGTLEPRPGDEYATRHNPFVYFHSLLDLGDCMADDVALDNLPAVLSGPAAKAPSYAFVVPNLCHSGTTAQCADGSPGGPAAADAFLRAWVPRILRSAAYRHDGALVIAFLSSATPSQGASAPPRTGALVLSRFAKAGASIGVPYDPYSLLRSAEDIFGLAPLAEAKHAASFARAALPGAF
jgi:hypothetical protein